MNKLKFLLLIVMVLFFFSCQNRTKNIDVIMENNSDIYSEIEIATLVDDSLYSSHLIKRNNKKVSYTQFELTIPKENELTRIMFFIIGQSDTVSCIVKNDSIERNSTIHVNFNEVLFKKGDSFKGFILDNDSVVNREFYCEVKY